MGPPLQSGAEPGCAFRSVPFFSLHRLLSWLNPKDLHMWATWLFSVACTPQNNHVVSPNALAVNGFRTQKSQRPFSVSLAYGYGGMPHTVFVSLNYFLFIFTIYGASSKMSKKASGWCRRPSSCQILIVFNEFTERPLPGPEKQWTVWPVRPAAPGSIPPFCGSKRSSTPVYGIARDNQSSLATLPSRICYHFGRYMNIWYFTIIYGNTIYYGWKNFKNMV